MLEFYPQIRTVHIAAIMLSGSWMAVRLISLAFGQHWPRSMFAQLLGWTIDGTVLTAATMLLTILPSESFTNHWLTVKLACVALYFGAGWTALSRARSRRKNLLIGTASLASFTCAYAIAKAHDPIIWSA